MPPKITSARIIRELRANGISAELFPSSDKMKKQMNYANSNNVPYVAIIGEQEIENGTIAVKDMATGEQKQMTTAELTELLK